ncbi:MAG: sensor histidine kinase N-terminal domain-containing protein [Gammaproteobacteria bacterium]|nr:sensor histidine kinase N-terminal domain-containing protein [Gammaproteobacteria bacterium]
MSSLKARLLGWLLAGVLAVGAIGGWIVYLNALSEADAFFDSHLRETALILRDQPVAYRFAPQFPQADAAYDFVVQVWSLDGVRVYLSRPHAVLPDITTLGFSTVATSEGRWRVFGVQALTTVIQVAQPMKVREQRAAELALQTLKPFALLLPGLALLVWFAVGHALEPLKPLTALLRARRADALDSLPAAPLPDEVQPLVEALNGLLARLRAALERERAFMADAAHELRTPLTALHLQMEMLARASGEGERTAAMETLSAGVQRAIRLVEQMLALARQEPRADALRLPVRLDDLARSVVAELVPLADAGGIDLGVATAEPVSVAGDPDALATLLRNLVDNAVRYTSRGGRVDVTVEGPGPTPGPRLSSDPAQGPRLTVTDDGPGIPPAERPRVFDRFYRRAGSEPPGSGLGLAIVKAIASAHGATVELADGPSGKGLAVSVIFAGDGSPRPA